MLLPFRVSLAASLAVLLFTPVSKAQNPIAVIPAQSEILFTARQMGVPIEGRFQKFDARIVLDPRKPESGSVTVTIELGSASLGTPEIDAELLNPAWLAIGKFPSATFQSSQIRALGNGRFDVAGKLSLKGVVRDVAIPMAITQSGDVSTARGTLPLKRLDFRIGDGDWADPSLVANEVQISIKLALRGVGKL